MPYAILRFEKRRGGSAAAIEKHHERDKESYKSNRDIDRERSPLNYHLKECSNHYYYEIQSRIEAAKCRVRRDSVKYVDTFIGGTNSFITNMSVEEQREYFQRAYDFIAERVGERNIFTATVHMDEATPHMHLCFVPLTKDNRLSAKEVLGNRVSMVKWQDDFHAHMSERWSELERGASAIETGRKHVPTWLFKQADRLDKEMEGIRAALEDINAFNAGKKRDKALEKLSKWLPSAENFTAQVKTVDGYIKSLERGNKSYEQQLETQNGNLRDQIEEKDDSLLKYKSEVYHLKETLRKQQRLLERIPPELREQLSPDKNRKKER